MYFDSHCHVHDERIPGGSEAAVRAAFEAGVTTMISVGCDRATSLAAISVAEANDNVWATVGLHPHDAINGVDTIADLVHEHKVVAIGETGLDYFYDHSPRSVQRTAFAAQIRLALFHDMPIVVHTRDAWDDTFKILSDEGVPKQIIFHCFTGGPTEADQCLHIGGFVSFSGIVTFKTAVQVQAAAKLVPLDRLLIETDAPYLAPVPHRGKANQPAWVGEVSKFIADLRDVPPDIIATATRNNGALAFSLVTS